jgi:hypothetical protein
MSKSLPKSLHTVTALVRVARHVQSRHGVMSNATALEKALDILGYSKSQDDYKLCDLAAKQMGGYDL